MDNYLVQLPPWYADPTYPFGGAALADNMPVTNPITNAGATLGRVLFYDTRLSANNTIACASCHQQAHAFADPNRFSTGFLGGHTSRNAPNLTDNRYYANGHYFWDERANTLEDQVLGPIQNPVEMGMDLATLESKVGGTSFYPPLFTAAFGDPAVTSDRISKALAQFVRSLVSYQSKYDQALNTGPGNPPDFQGTFTPSEFNGFAIFARVPGRENESMDCAVCHRNVEQTLGAQANFPPGAPPGPFATNNGLNLDSTDDPGAGNGNFKAPSLRNIEVTAPYMHDGRFATLEDVVDFYANDVQDNPFLNPHLRVNDNPNGPVEHFNLTPQQKADLVAFLKTLTDQAFLTDPKFSSPFPE